MFFSEDTSITTSLGFIIAIISMVISSALGFSKIRNKQGKHDDAIVDIIEKINKTEARVCKLEERTAEHDTIFASVNEKLDNIKSDISDLKNYFIQALNKK